MSLAPLYKKLSDAIAGVERASSPATVWSHVKDFGSELNCDHCFALDRDRLPDGLTKALLYSDAPIEICMTIDQEGLNVDHPFEMFASRSSVPFLVSDVRRDERFQGLRWSELMSSTLREGDAFVAPVRTQGGAQGGIILGGREIKDTPIARASLMVMAHAAFDRIGALSIGEAARAEVLLTSRELDCLQMLARGLTDDDVARVLDISRRTVRYHVDQTKRKFGVSSRVHAVAAAVNRGLISL